uniref:Uncharacterized protein n=1 Tax=Oryza nivara TaxID=4536 RepID=A0A0E0I516_ORYNI
MACSHWRLISSFALSTRAERGLTSRKERVPSFRLSISIQKRRYKLQCPRDSSNSEVLCKLGSDLGGT